MFKEWGFLLTEIWVLLALAVLVGLIAGWLIWGGRPTGDNGYAEDEITRLRAELERVKAARRSSIVPAEGTPDPRPAYVRPAQPAAQPAAATPPVAAQEPPSAEPTPAPATPIAQPLARPAAQPMAKPQGLTDARDGLPDDLTKINGIGPKLEKLCQSLGFWHYDQIAAWTNEEIAWVDENLEGFKGRVTRDRWVEQAKALARNEPPAFVRRRD